MILSLEKVHLRVQQMAGLKYLLLSPVNRYGGVNLDVGFMASIIAEQHRVEVHSLGRYFDDASVFYFDPTLAYTSVDRELYHSSFMLRTWARITQLLKPMAIPIHHRLDNSLSRKFSDLETARKKHIRETISNCDVLVLCAQLTANYMECGVNAAAAKGIPVVFRTTGQITERQLTSANKQWLDKVACIIHHSQQNKSKAAHFLPEARHLVIDQNAYDEARFLKLAAVNTPVTRFYTIGRLSPLKRNLQVIQAFKALSLSDIALHIYGDGEEEQLLKEAAASHAQIHFHGALGFEQIHQAHGANDCLIISSRVEAGPYTGIEAMASGRLIISTVVGAMPSRLLDYPYFYDGSTEDLIDKMQQICQLKSKEVSDKAIALRDRYKAQYGEEKIRAAYRKALFDILD